MRPYAGSYNQEHKANMIDALRHEDIIRKCGGRFKLTVLIQKRMLGARPRVERPKGMTDMEVAIKEIIEDKIAIDYDKSDIPTPAQLKE